MRSRLTALIAGSAVAIALVIAWMLIATTPRAAAQAVNPTRWSIAALGPDAVAGKTFDAVISVTIESGWKVYSLTQKPGGPTALVITVPEKQVFESAGAAAGPLPHISFDPNFGFDTETYTEQADFQVPVKSAADASLAGATLRVIVRYQACNQRLCNPPTDVELTANTTSG